ncbi:class I SAM-dependent methyltransferase [Candidatus Neomarinimicrobiota bacterium]
MTAHFGITEGTSICDFGCGPGLWTTRFAERGADVTGIDLSERSLRYAENVAQEQRLAIRYIRQDYLEFSTDDRFDLITMIHGDFSVLSPEQRVKILQKFHTLLSDDGTVMLDVASMEQFNGAKEERTYDFSPTPSTYTFHNRFKYEQECLLVDQYTNIDGDNERTIYVWNQCYTTDSLTRLFEENGLSIEEFYSDMSGAPFKEDSPMIAVVARKTT